MRDPKGLHSRKSTAACVGGGRQAAMRRHKANPAWQPPPLLAALPDTMYECGPELQTLKGRLSEECTLSGESVNWLASSWSLWCSRSRMTFSQAAPSTAVVSKTCRCSMVRFEGAADSTAILLGAVNGCVGGV